MRIVSARVYHKKETSLKRQQNPGVEITQTQTWLATHTPKNGSARCEYVERQLWLITATILNYLQFKAELKRNAFFLTFTASRSFGLSWRFSFSTLFFTHRERSSNTTNANSSSH